MFEVIKDKIWNLLKEKKISLAMIYDTEGKILWHKGRKIFGKNVFTGRGFCQSYIQESLKNPTRIDEDDYISSRPQDLSKSAQELLLKSIIIHPIQRKFFLYIDSGKKEYFTDSERISLRIMGELLEQVIEKIEKEADISEITGKSEAIEKIRDLVLKFSLEEEPVLLSGETGVGKNHIAALIHRYSGRSGKLVIVDTPNIADHLFESKLFGHKKGSFTDARFDKTGLVEEASQGTLFFDEITEVPLDVQAKLLRFIDTQKFYVLGESTEKEGDVRIIAATNEDLATAVECKKFRKDLYYRLNVLEIDIPPLRKRKQDIKHLVLENRLLLREKEIGDDFWDVMLEHEWPGNARELLNILKRAGIMLEPPLTGQKLSTLLQKSETKPAQQAEENTKLAEIENKIKSGETYWQAIWQPFIDRDLDRDIVKDILRIYYKDCSCSFKKMIKKFNLPEKDYQKFMSLLYKYKLDPRK